VFWITASLLGFDLSQQLPNVVWNVAVRSGYFLESLWLSAVVMTILNVLPLIWLCAYVARGRVAGGRLWQFIAQSRLRLGLVAFLALLLMNAWRWTFVSGPAWFPLLMATITPLTLVVIMLWLLPTQRQTAKL